MLVSKIAIVNPYLQGGHAEIAECESSLRFINAGKKLSIDIRVFSHSDDVEAFDPDFVVGITYQEAKFSKYPSYVSLNIAPSLIKDVPKFVRNILSYDGFMTVSPSVSEWLNQLCAEHHKKPYIAHAAFSVPQTPFQLCDFSQAKAMYMGTNWDGMRHRHLFTLLEDGKFLQCYGPKNSWSHYPETLYAGEVPFDGVSAFDFYRKLGIGLCINHPDFDKEGIASSRIFEIAASSALPLCADNTLIKRIYGDSVLYLDETETTQALAQQIIEKVTWVRNNPAKAQEMAREAHKRFNEQASMEQYIRNLVEHHQKVIREKGYLNYDSMDVMQPKVTYLLASDNMDASVSTVIEDLKKQTYRNIDIVLLLKEERDVDAACKWMDLTNYGNLYPVKYDCHATNQMLRKQLKATQTEWIGILTPSVRVFPNHTAVMLKNYEDFFKNKTAPLSALQAYYLESSDTSILEDYMAEQHWIESNNKVRIGLNNVRSVSGFGSMLFTNKLLDSALFQRVNFMELAAEYISTELEKIGEVERVYEVTTRHDINSRFAKKSEYDYTNEIVALNQTVSEQAAQIKEIYASRSWVYTAPLRKLLAVLRGVKNTDSAKTASEGV